MAVKVAINGFGRIGRAVFRIASARDDVQIVAVNDLVPRDTLAYLLKYDTVMGRFGKSVSVTDEGIQVGDELVKMFAEPELGKLPWGELGIDVVVESTGVFRERAQIEKHLGSGAGRVVLTVPAKDALDATVVLGVNDADLKPEHKLVSNASCTTNCLAPVAKVLHERFGLVKGYMTTVHAYTNDQRIEDAPHSDLRRSRAAAENTIPTTTGAAKAVGKVLPELAGKLNGEAMRVPIPDGSLVDLTAVTEKSATVEEVNAAIREYAGGAMQGILGYTEDPVVSSDILGDPHSSIFDASCTQVPGDKVVRVMSWYDNEWGYSNRVCDLIARLGELDAAS